MAGQSQTCHLLPGRPYLADLDNSTLAKGQGLRLQLLLFFLGTLIPIQPSKPKSGQHGLAGGSSATLLPLNYSKLHQPLLHLRATHISVLPGALTD